MEGVVENIGIREIENEEKNKSAEFRERRSFCIFADCGVFINCGDGEYLFFWPIKPHYIEASGDSTPVED